MINVKNSISRYLPKFIKGSWLEKLIVYILALIIKQNHINKFLDSNKHAKGFDFIDAVLDYFQFSYQVSARETESIPVSGRCIIIANHPLGALDSLALMHFILNIRPDVRIVANKILTRLDSLDDYLLPVNNIKGEFSHSKMTAINRALEAEMAVIIFPAGGVSRSNWFKVRDTRWSKGFYLFSKRAKSDIIPVFIGGRNSFWFYLVSKINSILGMLLLPRQMWYQKNKVINLKIGAPLSFDLISNIPVKDRQKVAMLRKHVYLMGKNRAGLFRVPYPVAHPERKNDLRIAINNCKVLGNNNHPSILLFKSKKDSALLREIGRLRELTFRQVGEGSQKRRDIDKFDSYYRHLIVWNDEDLEIMGAYRVMPTANILKDKKLIDNRIYTQGLFDYKGNLEWLERGLELGRSFIQPKYWGTRGLDYLWQGIGAYCANRPNIRYLFGTVSISSNYPKIVVDYLVAFYRYYYFTPSFNVCSKNSYKLSESKQEYYNNLFKNKDINNAYKEMKSSLREANVVIPTLFKHYSEFCEIGGVSFTDFGVDPNFNGCIDGFVIIDLNMIKKTKYQRYIEPFVSKKVSV